MNELLISISMILIFTGLIYSISYILIKKLKINHPKDRSRIYTMMMISILLIFLLSVTVIGSNIYVPLTDDNNNSDYSLVFVVDETQGSTIKDMYLEDTSSSDLGLELLTNEKNQIDTESAGKIMSFLINSPKDLTSIISQIKQGDLNTLLEGFENEITFNNQRVYSKTSPENHIRTQSFDINFFIILHIILIGISIFYLIYTFIIAKKMIIKNINANKCRDKEILKIIEKLCHELKIKTPDTFLFNGESNAFVFGYPATLVISKNLVLNLTKKELEIALRHELAHISNKDNILKPLLQTMRIVFFYNPLVHIIYKKIIDERELLADTKFIHTKQEKIKFMEILFKVNDLNKNQRFFSKKIYCSSALSLVKHKTKKLDITDRFNNLFSINKKRTIITAFICMIILLSNISLIVVANSDFLKSSVYGNEKDENDSLIDNDEVGSNFENLNTIYILRLIKQRGKPVDVIVIKEALFNS